MSVSSRRARAGCGLADADYAAVGVTVLPTREALVGGVDVVVKVRPPLREEVELLGKGQTISFFWPAQNKELLDLAAERGATPVVAMDMVPRISRAQKMDALSPMANIAGYRAVIEAANNWPLLHRQVTAAGKVPPCW